VRELRFVVLAGSPRGGGAAGLARLAARDRASPDALQGAAVAT
jgi:hypothetical protein